MMSTTKFGRVSGLIAGVLAAVLLAGCASTSPKPWNLSINKTTSASIQVDLIGIAKADEPYWQGYNLDKYWSDGDLRRKNAQPLTQILKMGQPWVIPMTDPKWNEWFAHGATELLIIGNLPGHFDAGPADPRRRFLPLDKKSWDAKNNTLEIEVQDTQILVNTPQKPN
jgi:hypothetical protein